MHNGRHALAGLRSPHDSGQILAQRHDERDRVPSTRDGRCGLRHAKYCWTPCRRSAHLQRPQILHLKRTKIDTGKKAIVTHIAQPDGQSIGGESAIVSSLRVDPSTSPGTPACRHQEAEVAAASHGDP